MDRTTCSTRIVRTSLCLFVLASLAPTGAQEIPPGTIRTIAGDGKAALSADGLPATQASLNVPTQLAVDAAGNLYIGDYGNNRVRMVSTDGMIRTVAGGGNPTDGLGDGGQATGAQLEGPNGLTFDAAGNLYIADNRKRRVRKMSPDGVITTIAGTGQAGFSGDGGPALEARLSGPWGVAVDPAGTLFLADTGRGSPDGTSLQLLNNRVRAVYGAAVPR
jgi:DNA-binding beta-propeller fold protein YncE